MIINVGISGTRYGASPKQLNKIVELLMDFRKSGAKNFRHGDCIGVDIEAANIARKLGYYIIKHPGPIGMKTEADETMVPLPFLDRNKVIVRMSGIMLIVPYSNKEIMRSGTWATYRYAKKINVPIRMVER